MPHGSLTQTYRLPSSGIEAVLLRMLKQQEPFPLTVMDAGYNIIRANDAALRIFQNFCLKPPAPAETINLFDLVFSPERARRFIQNWRQLGGVMVTRLHHEALRKSDDTQLWSLLDRVLAYPEVPVGWKHFNIENDASPTCPLILANDNVTLTFVMTVTAFSAPRHVAIEEMRVNRIFPRTLKLRLTAEESPIPVLALQGKIYQQQINALIR